MARRMLASELLAGARGSRLCYGKPVRVGDRALIPVARVWSAGGGGWGYSGKQDQGDEGGGFGGIVDAVPVGYLELTADGSQYVPIRDLERSIRTLRSAATAIGALAAAAGAVRALRDGELPRLRHARGRRLLGRGR
jgi:hypothetical protein